MPASEFRRPPPCGPSVPASVNDPVADAATWDERLVPFPFRIDLGDDPGPRWVSAGLPAFPRLRRLHEMSAHFELSRRHLGDAWWADPRGSEPSRELEPLLVQISQKLSETTDFYRSVDFVDDAVLREMVASRPDLFEHAGLPRAGRCEDVWPPGARGRLHEHMVPLPFLRGLIRGTQEARTGIGRTDLEPAGRFGCEASRSVLLWHLSFRALIAAPTPADGGGRRSSLPESILRIGPRGERDDLPLRELPVVFYPLARYHACGLLDRLVPVNERARRLKTAFRRYLATGRVVFPAIAAEGEAAGVSEMLRDAIGRFSRRLEAEPARAACPRRERTSPSVAPRRAVARDGAAAARDRCDACDAARGPLNGGDRVSSV